MCECNPSGDWWWDGSDTDKIDAFWTSYIDGVRTIVEWSASAGSTPDLVFLGAETDSLFRTDAYWSPRSTELVDAVRTDTSAWSPQPALSFAYGAQVLLTPSAFPGTQGFFTEMDLDYVGVTAYFPLFADDSTERYGPHGRCTYENRWTAVMEQVGEYWANDTSRPVLFLELGVPNSINAPFMPSAAGEARVEEFDALQSLLEDGDETQGNDLWGYFRARTECNDVVAGQFLWNNPISIQSEWDNAIQTWRQHGVRSWENSSGVTVDYVNDIVATEYEDAVWAYSRAPDDDTPFVPGATDTGRAYTGE